MPLAGNEPMDPSVWFHNLTAALAHVPNNKFKSKRFSHQGKRKYILLGGYWLAQVVVSNTQTHIITKPNRPYVIIPLATGY